jgi:hypothetical protein
MKLEETFSPTGDLRYRMLRKMLRIVTKHGLALETISNWALGIVGLGGGFIIANIDKVDKHVSLCSRRWLFRFGAALGRSWLSDKGVERVCDR